MYAHVPSSSFFLPPNDTPLYYPVCVPSSQHFLIHTINRPFPDKMGRNGVFGQLSGIDAFGKTMDDVRIRTNIGALITLTSFILIAFLTLGEFISYRKIHEKTELIVDISRGEKLTINMNMTFPRVPCYLLSIDIMDISGESQLNLMHDITRTRLHQDGSPVPDGQRSTIHLNGEIERVAKTHDEKYCGSCYGGEPPESGCCNTCEEVQEAYVRKGWSFGDPEHVDQCVKEHWSDKIKEQANEGCNVAGKVHVNKVVGNLHMSTGRAFQRNSQHMHDLVPYLAGKGTNHHDFGHKIHEFSFDDDSAFKWTNEDRLAARKMMGIVDPLSGLWMHTEKSQFMIQYFLKVVPTELRLMSNHLLKGHQYSVTSYERDLDMSPAHQQEAAKNQKEVPGKVQHGFMGMPGVFFNFDISGLKMVRVKYRKSLSHFLTSTCAIVGGVLTVAGIIDAAVHASRIRMGMQSSTGGGASHWEGGGVRLGGKLV